MLPRKVIQFLVASAPAVILDSKAFDPSLNPWMAGYPRLSVIGAQRRSVVMGDALQSRTGALRGVVNFTVL